jgi:predicted CXXCH cytochrome family protein
MAKNRRGSKGTYGDVRLPVARAYVRPASRNRFLALGGAGLAVLAVLAGWSVLRRDAGLISNGPLTSAHAAYESDCAACHGGGGSSRGVVDATCRDCHERRGDPEVYTLAAHWSASPADQRRDPLPAEIACAACHLEHRGRRAEIARVADSLCLGCHDFGSFSTRHPEFDFAADGIPDSDTLTFPHSHHVNEVMRRRSLADPESACLACHEPSSAGGGFRPIDFDRHCSSCHLTATVRTPPLPVTPVASAASADNPALGVETLEAVRRRRGPADRWADDLSTAEFLRFGNRVIKTPLRHRDPWVLHNLRLLRRRLYPDAGMADLLVASGDAAPGEARELYREAIATLERQAEALRSRPERELQVELVRVEALLGELRRRVETPDARFDGEAFRLAGASDGGATAPDPAEVEAIGALAADLTEACRRCHLVRDATIVRVEPDQRTLRRAEFDHRPHVLQRRCLDCHDAIPVPDFLGQEKGAPATVDHASIQNLPRIATCRECHTPRRASESCVTCHVFHPDARRRPFAMSPGPTRSSRPSGAEGPAEEAEEDSDAG